jgi:hypothetical protein
VRLVGMAVHLRPVDADDAASAHRGDAPDRAGRWAFAPVVVTPDELGAPWHQGRIDGTWTFATGSPGRAPRVCAIGLQADVGAWLAAAAGLAAVQAGTVVLLPQPPAEVWRWREGEALRLGARAPDGSDLFGTLVGAGASAG